MSQEKKLKIIAGPCVIEENFDLIEFAGKLKEIADRYDVEYTFKASFDKANRTSLDSYRGPGLEKGMATLAKVKEVHGLPICTDVHEVHQMDAVAEVADIIQIPAFLCRQTDLVVAAAKTGKVVNVKKGQFLAPKDMKNVVDKINAIEGSKLTLTERGFSFGYNNLVVDMRGIVLMKKFGVPVILDATHSTQLPGGAGGSSAGESKFAKYLSRSAVACGADGLFLEVHPDPKNAASDKGTQVTLEEFEEIIADCVAIKEMFPE